MPYPVIALLLGVALALILQLPQLELSPDIVLALILPVLLFHGAATLDRATVRADLLPVGLLAVPGVVVTTAVGEARRPRGHASAVGGGAALRRDGGPDRSRHRADYRGAARRAASPHDHGGRRKPLQ